LFLSVFQAHYFNFSGISRGEFPVKIFCLWGFGAFCRADTISVVCFWLFCD
jgi:hypothetical protein